MKKGPKVQNWEVLDAVKATGSSIRNYESLGLKRGWDDILTGIIDKRFEEERKTLEYRASRLAGKTRKPKPAIA